MYGLRFTLKFWLWNNFKTQQFTGEMFFKLNQSLKRIWTFQLKKKKKRNSSILLCWSHDSKEKCSDIFVNFFNQKLPEISRPLILGHIDNYIFQALHISFVLQYFVFYWDWEWHFPSAPIPISSRQSWECRSCHGEDPWKGRWDTLVLAYLWNVLSFFLRSISRVSTFCIKRHFTAVSSLLAGLMRWAVSLQT